MDRLRDELARQPNAGGPAPDTLDNDGSCTSYRTPPDAHIPGTDRYGRRGLLYDSAQEVFAFDVRNGTPDAARLKWKTSIGKDRRLSGIRFVGGDLYAVASDNSLVRIDTATGRILDEYPLLWFGSVVEDGTHQYGFTPDGFAFALQLKPASK